MTDDNDVYKQEERNKRQPRDKEEGRMIEPYVRGRAQTITTRRKMGEGRTVVQWREEEDHVRKRDKGKKQL